MELFKLSILAFALYVQLHIGTSSFSEDMDIWSQENWQVSTFSQSTVHISSRQVEATANFQSFCAVTIRHLLFQGDPAEIGFTLYFDDLLKRSKSQQFHGLMGRSLGKTGFY